VIQVLVPDSSPQGLSWTYELDLGQLLAAVGATQLGPADDEEAAAEEFAAEGTAVDRTVAVLDQIPPGPATAAFVSGTDVRELSEWDLPGVASAYHRLAAWAHAGELQAVAEMASRDATRDDRVRVGADGRPDEVTPAAGSSVGLELVMSHPTAMDWAHLGVTLRWKLPATWAALNAGLIDLPRARLIAEATSPLSDDLARKVESKILRGAGDQTLGQLRASLRRAVIAADPEGAEERRKNAQRHAKVSLYPDPADGTATLTGTRLPAVHAAAAMARLTAIARAMKSAGQKGGLDYLRATAFIGLLLGTLPLTPPPEGDPGPDGPTDPGPADADRDPGPNGSADPAPDPGTSDSSDPDSDPGERPPRPGDPGHPHPGDGDQGSTDDHHDPVTDPPAPPDPDPPDDSGYRGPGYGDNPDWDDDDGPFDPGPPAPWPPIPATVTQTPPFLGQPPPPSHPAPASHSPPSDPNPGTPPPPTHPPPRDPTADDPPPGRPPPGQPSPASHSQPRHAPPASQPASRDRLFRPPPGLLELVISWRAFTGDPAGPATLTRVGPITAAQALPLALTASFDPHARWQVIITDTDGHAIAVETVRRRHRQSRARRSAGVTGTVAVTIPAATLDQLSSARTSTATPGQDGTGSGSGSIPGRGIRTAVLRAARRAYARALRQAEADAAAPGGCAHTMATPGYRPAGKLRDYITARDQTCRDPRCRQPARHTDLDHTTPWDQDGPTCSCNIGPRCRTHHKIKQLPGWTLTQTKPGFFQLTTPAGRSYTTTPDPYPA
jgi:hypothetical protein